MDLCKTWQNKNQNNQGIAYLRKPPIEITLLSGFDIGGTKCLRIKKYNENEGIDIIDKIILNK